MHTNTKLPYIQIYPNTVSGLEPLILSPTAGFPFVHPLPTTPAWFPKLPFDSQEGSHILQANIEVVCKPDSRPSLFDNICVKELFCVELYLISPLKNLEACCHSPSQLFSILFALLPSKNVSGLPQVHLLAILCADAWSKKARMIQTRTKRNWRPLTAWLSVLVVWKRCWKSHNSSEDLWPFLVYTQTQRHGCFAWSSTEQTARKTEQTASIVWLGTCFSLSVCDGSELFLNHSELFPTYQEPLPKNRKKIDHVQSIQGCLQNIDQELLLKYSRMFPKYQELCQKQFQEFRVIFKNM